MRHLTIRLMVVLAFATVVTGVAIEASAQHRQGNGVHGAQIRASHVKVLKVGDAVVRPHDSGRPIPFPHSRPHGPFIRPFGPFKHGAAGIGVPFVGVPVYVGDVPYFAGPEYYPPAPSYDPTAGLGMAGSAPPPEPPIIQYQDGRYELRGNGTSTPYVWVWVPDRPSAAPEAQLARSMPPPKIISIPSPDVATTPVDPTAPKVITIPAPETTPPKKQKR